MRVTVHTVGFADVDVSVGKGRQTFKWLSLVVCQRLESKVCAGMLVNGVCRQSQPVSFVTSVLDVRAYSAETSPQ
jgi:hypothetical protein